MQHRTGERQERVAPHERFVTESRGGASGDQIVVSYCVATEQVSFAIGSPVDVDADPTLQLKLAAVGGG